MTSAARAWHIYTLSDPRTGEVRYVGVSIDPERRLRSHRHSPRCQAEAHTHKARWIARLQRDGVEPRQNIIETGNGETWVAREAFWIAHYRALAPRLCNLSNGGEGSVGHAPTDETRARMAESQRGNANHSGHAHSEETKRRIAEKKRGVPNPKGAEALRGVKQSEEAKAKRSLAMMGHEVSEETRRKISAGHMGKVVSAETRARISAAGKGRKQTPEHVKKSADARRGRPCSEETKAKIGKANSGPRPPHLMAALHAAAQTPEARKNRGEAIAAAWARKRAANALASTTERPVHPG